MAHPVILIVDDDRVILRLCERILRQAGYDTLCTSDPQAALRDLQDNHLDLLLTDIIMPDMDGFELIARARAIQPDLAVLVMTSFGSVENALEALRRGVDGLMLKPVSKSDDLLEAVQQAMLQNQLKQDAGRLKALRPLFDVSEALISQTDPGHLLETIVAAMGQLFLARKAAIFERTPGNDGFRLLRSKGRLALGILNGTDGGIRQLLQADKSPQSLRDAWTEPAIKALLGRLELGSIMCVDVPREKRPLVFLVGRGLRESDFIESDFERLGILAHQSAVALENAGLYEDLRLTLKRVEDSQVALVQSEKMAAAGRMVSSVAHEINNPLQAVRNCLHLAVHEDVPEDQKTVYIELAQKELDRLETTVDRMLDFSRPGRTNREWVDVCGLMERVLAYLKLQLKEREIQVEIDHGDEIPKVNVIRDQLQQVFLNILINAMDEIGTSTLITRKIWIRIHTGDNRVFIEIEDSGRGISPEIRQRIFEPFFSTKIRGTGLGLAISYEILKAQDGRLGLSEPQHGSGACFEIVLPIKGKNGHRKNPGSR